MEKNICKVFIKRLENYQYSIQSRDRIWDLIFPISTSKWFRMHVTNYNGTWYIGNVDGDYPIIEVGSDWAIKVSESMGSFSSTRFFKEPIPAWNLVFQSALHWMDKVDKNWISASLHIEKNYPLNKRKGIIPHSLVRAKIDQFFRIDKELGAAKVNKFISIVESGYFYDSSKQVIHDMSANDYFEYCKIGYVAAVRKDESIDASLSARKMYEKYADGRHEGLLDIDPDSKDDFRAWLDGKHPKRTTGGHPWEIKRGGNTTHIDLSVRHPDYFNENGYIVELRGRAITRLAETLKMFLAIHEKGLPISIDDPEGIRKRLLAQDNIGIVPEYDTLHRANQTYDDREKVYDVCYYQDLGRQKRALTPFIVWKPLPLLVPRK